MEIYATLSINANLCVASALFLKILIWKLGPLFQDINNSVHKQCFYRDDVI